MKKRNFTGIELIAVICILSGIALIILKSLEEAQELVPEPSELIEQEAQTSAHAVASVSIPIPTVTYFQERRTIAKWTERWDKPNLPCYIYLVSFGNILGYYVTDGKPTSTRSYILPEFKEVWRSGVGTGSSYAGLLVPSADMDGTYGANNAGIRFFTAEGTAVEWAGEGASYIYSDAPLPLNVPKLNVEK